MRAKWKYITVITLLLMGVMQVLPFAPAPEDCEAECCNKPVNCCQAEVKTGCDMVMTSCNVSMFMPLMSAPLVKVNSAVQLDISTFSTMIATETPSHKQVNLNKLLTIQEAPPPQYLPLLI
ncbi:hypothetical protein HQ531_07150 [bacterium]|nr:hypothetical protein [bacterium]